MKHKTEEQNRMKKLIVPALIGLSAMTLVTGCVAKIGGGSTCKPQVPTTGQQLIDLQKAKEAGAITASEYEAEKAKLLGRQ